MKAIQVSQPGAPEAMQLVDIPVPEPKANEALVKIEAIGVNFIDVYHREGRYKLPIPFIPGSEMSGTVTKVGSEVKDLRPGDRVAQTGVVGTYAEYQAVPADRLVKLPDHVDFKTAASAMLQGGTMHYLMRSTYPLKAGETALVHAAAGGMGTLLTQFGKKIGARIIGTAGSDDKVKLAKQNGADEVINYSKQDFVAEVKRLTDGKGVDVAYDGVGKSTFEDSLNCLKPRGYMVLFGGASGAVPPFDPLTLTAKGSLYLTRPSLNHYTLTREEYLWRMTEVLNLIAGGDLKIHIGHVYKLADAAQAHRDLEGRKTTGKVLLLP
ncbi:MAG TPA: quinone oxidoreductase [Terriglobales bacterium]|nr:quinone oxidoreductase [Terriglobales bacterium]